MWRIRGDQAEISTGASQLPDFFEQIYGHAAKIVGRHEVESRLEINTDDDEVRITPVARALAIKRDDSLIIIDRAFRPKAANNSKGLHLLATGQKPTAQHVDTNR